jgi:hypothetical protein
MLDRVLAIRLLFGLGVATAVLLAFAGGVGAFALAFGTSSDATAGVRADSIASALPQGLIPALVVGGFAAYLCHPVIRRR